MATQIQNPYEIGSIGNVIGNDQPKLSTIIIKAILGLFLGCFASGVIFAAIQTFSNFSIEKILSLSLVIGVFGFIIGIFIVVFYGLPVYLSLRKNGYANSYISLLEGAIPGFIICFFDMELGLTFLLFGCLSALFIHLLIERH